MSRFLAFCLLGATVALATLGCGKKPEPTVAPQPVPEPAPEPRPLPQPGPSDGKKDAATDKKAEAAARLKQIGLAMHNFESNYGHFPAGIVGPKGQLGLSWRVQILPYLGEAEAKLFEQFNLKEPWDSEHNKKLLAKMPAVFAPVSGSGVEGKTHLRAFAGQLGFIPWSPVPPGSKDAQPPAPWANVQPGQPAHGRSIGSIADGTSNTFMVVEAQEAVEWTRPDDLPFHDTGRADMLGAKLSPLPRLGGLYPGGFHAVMCDARVHFFPDTLSEKGLRALITTNANDFTDEGIGLMLFAPQPPKSVPKGIPDTFPDAAALKTAVTNLLAVVKGVHAYHDENGQLPAGIVGPKNTLGLSWRVQILPFIGEDKLYKEFKLEEAWDSDHNKKLIDKMPTVFASPGRADKGRTFLRMTVGRGGLSWVGRDSKGEMVAMIDPPPPAQPGLPMRGRTINLIPDGIANTLLIVEGGTAVAWTKPDELLLPESPRRSVGKEAAQPKLPALGGVFADGFHAALAEGTVVFYRSDYPASELAKLFCPDDGKPVNPFGDPSKIGYTAPFPRENEPNDKESRPKEAEKAP
ncbi:MAG: DUF1559 domain-containing protein [Gemmataceae bacterium]|nr:DUF1559 domain-containing protein [Gemmataceae bacterium]